MDFSIPVYPYRAWPSLDSLVRAVQHAEERGMAAVDLPDHLVVPSAEGTPSLPGYWFHSTTLAAFLAAHTTTMRLMLKALVFPYRSVFELGKQIATLDVVSGGRLTVVVGSGWLREEFAALRVAFADRGDRTDEYLEALKILWTDADPVYHGRFVDFEDVAFEPGCVQEPHVPMWIGGTAGKRRPLRRVARLGDGWAALSIGTGDDLRRDVRILEEELHAVGRTLDDVTLSHTLLIGKPLAALAQARERHLEREGRLGPEGGDTGSVVGVSAVIDRIVEYQTLGFEHLSLRFAWATPDDYLRWLDWFAEKIVPNLDA